MAEARFRIAFAGPHVAVQDGGRPGLMRFGVTRSGPMDRLAHAAANRALGRPADAPAVEVSLGGLTLDCLAGAVTVAVAGGGFVVAHDGRRHGSWVVLRLAAGERLQIRPGHWGSWCYLACAGTLAHATWLGSAATHTMSGRGGGLLSTGGELVVTDPDPAAAPHGPLRCPVFARPLARASVVPGPQDHELLPDALPTLLGAEWRVSSAYDRMGMRLEGPPLALGDALSIPSQAIVAGSLQVSGDGVPTLLMRDHQTTGGYPKIATVLDCDLDRVAQLRPRDTLRLTAVTPEEAIRRARAAASLRAAWLDRLGAEDRAATEAPR